MWTFGRKITAGFAIAFLLLCAIGAVAYRNINVLYSTSLMVTEANDVLNHVDVLLSQVKDAETGQRGYVITGDEQYLEPYNNAIAALPTSIGELRRITVAFPDQQKRLDQVEPIIAAKLEELKIVIDLRRKGDADGAIKEVRTGRGKRFAVIADEIRKLADRVGGSTKEIRSLIEEIRSSVNTTVMATEGGSKAVDLGARQFMEVTTSLRQITDLLLTTTQASKEIELSTKQQATAVEQVNIAISNVARASKETEVSSNQTLQTAGRLAGLSRELTRLIQAATSA